MALFLIYKIRSAHIQIINFMDTLYKTLVSICLALYSYTCSFAQSHVTPTLPELYEDASHGKDEPKIKSEKVNYENHSQEKSPDGLPFFLYHEKVDSIQIKAQKDVLKKSTQKHKNKAADHI